MAHVRSHDHSVGADGSPIAVAGVPNLPAARITSETFDDARIPGGIARDVEVVNAIINHAGDNDAHHPVHVKTLADHPLNIIPTMDTAHIPNLAASKITSGQFGLPRMPRGADGLVLTGTGVGSNPVYEAVAGGDGDMLKSTYDPNEDGIIDADQIGNLPASKITSGIFDNARIPQSTRGSYSGNDTVNRAIPHGLGVTPALVLLVIDANYAHQYNIYGSWPYIHFMDDGSYYRWSVTVLNATNFYVGNASDYDDTANGGGRLYQWVAIA